MALVVHLLDDFLDTLESLPPELQAGFNELYRLEQELEELCKSLSRKRIVYLKADEKGMEATMQANFIKKIEKEETKGAAFPRNNLFVLERALLEKKIQLGQRLQGRLQEALKRLDDGIATCCTPFPLLPSHSEVLMGIDRAPKSLQELLDTKKHAIASAPKKAEEGLVYCYCRQVSWGDMVQCEGAECTKKWFHYACVGLSVPPKGKWFCKDCTFK